MENPWTYLDGSEELLGLANEPRGPWIAVSMLLKISTPSKTVEDMLKVPNLKLSTCTNSEMRHTAGFGMALPRLEDT